MKRKLTLEEINFIIEDEDRCGVQNLIQYIFSDKNSTTGLDVIAEIIKENGIDKIGKYEVVKGNTLKIKTNKPSEEIKI